MCCSIWYLGTLYLYLIHALRAGFGGFTAFSRPNVMSINYLELAAQVCFNHSLLLQPFSDIPDAPNNTILLGVQQVARVVESMH